MISIMTTMILIIVISLIVLGFASLSRRNQRESLDRQLSTQAFYAAESGVNDAREAIKAAPAGTVIPEKTSCTGTAGGFYNANPVIDNNANVKYSCLLVDPSPTVLRYTDVGTNSIVVPITAKSGTISRIELTWQSKITSGDPMTGCWETMPSFTTTSGWGCGYGVLRFDLVPTSGTFTAASLASSTMTTFAIPVWSGSFPTIPYAPGASNNNVKTPVYCLTANCKMTVNNLTQNSYHMRISSIYRNASLQIRAYNSAGTVLEIEGSQALIDVTGRAQDVLRRVQVSVPLRANSNNDVSDYAIQSTDSICKRFSVMDNYFDSDVSGVSSSNRLCQP
ncbi:MAG TPA: hypothetical protein VD735_04360 [Candidatus Saccharimonadales bacterium]|nr:hypothetical protein [Candidatus Saccharimonadales bacterium]